MGVLQRTFIPSLTYQGAWRAQIDGVRVSKTERGRGVGEALIREALGRARNHGCQIVQLTTDKRRDCCSGRRKAQRMCSAAARTQGANTISSNSPKALLGKLNRSSRPKPFGALKAFVALNTPFT